MEPSRINVEDAKDKMAHGQEIFFLDTRTDKAWAAADQKLPGATRLSVDEVEFWSHKLPRDKLIITYDSAEEPPHDFCFFLGLGRWRMSQSL